LSALVNKTAKKHLSAREAALKALVRVEQDGAYLNLALPGLLENLSPRERALASRIASGTIQHFSTVDWALNRYLKNPLEKLTPWIRNLMRLSAYQLLYLERVPAHAAVDEAVNLARRYGHRGVAGLVNAVLRRLAGQGGDLPWPDIDKHPAEYLSLRHSHPLWLVQRWVRRYGLKETEAICRANNETAPLTLRPNSLRIGAAQLQDQLLAEGAETEFSPRIPGILMVKSHQSPAGLDSFKNGLFTIQGEGSALVAPLLDPRPGQMVLDLCSAPGGKTTHLAELMGDRGAVNAADVHPHRLQLVDTAARRLGLTSIRTLAVDGRKIGDAGLPRQDRILVDAPCSGLGVIRRLPELKWRRREADLPEMQKLQLELLSAAVPLLKPGGTLLYSVCTNEWEETAEVVKEFSSRHPELTPHPGPHGMPEALSGAFAADGTATLMPHRHGVDGFFIALWTI
jgi:16S rRNA (cytosine967-C5)-methyltransferase